MEPIKVFSSMAVREVLRELTRRYEVQQRRGAVLEAAGGVDVAKRLRTGERADVVVLSRSAIEALCAEGVLRADSIMDIAQSGIGVAVSADASVPDISSEAAVRRAVEHAASLSYSTGPSGVYLEQKFEAWGILGALRPRIVVPPPGTPVASLVASGRAALGFQQLSELLNVPGITLVGPLPPDVQLMTLFSGAVARGADAETAGALLAYLASPPTGDIKRRFGMEAC